MLVLVKDDAVDGSDEEVVTVKTGRVVSTVLVAMLAVLLALVLAVVGDCSVNSGTHSPHKLGHISKIMYEIPDIVHAALLLPLQDGWSMHTNVVVDTLDIVVDGCVFEVDV